MCPWLIHQPSSPSPSPSPSSSGRRLQGAYLYRRARVRWKHGRMMKLGLVTVSGSTVPVQAVSSLFIGRSFGSYSGSPSARPCAQHQLFAWAFTCFARKWPARRRLSMRELKPGRMLKLRRVRVREFGSSSATSVVLTTVGMVAALEERERVKLKHERVRHESVPSSANPAAESDSCSRQARIS